MDYRGGQFGFLFDNAEDTIPFFLASSARLPEDEANIPSC